MTATAPPPGARIDLATLPNLRDLGGWTTRDGRVVRRRRLYRSTALNRLAGPDLQRVAALGLRTVVDLRTAAERETEPDAALPGAAVLVADVLADLAQGTPVDLPRVVADPSAADRLFGDGRAVPLFVGAYRAIVSLPSALAAYRRMFDAVLEPPRLPLLFHCTTGKDRTGWGAAATLLLLGVPEADVRREYLLTNRDLLPSLTPLFDGFRARGGDPRVLEPVLGVDGRYLEAALDEMRGRFGTVEGYFRDGLGMDETAQEALRAALTEPRRP